jgi:hypothetical protein
VLQLWIADISASLLLLLLLLLLLNVKPVKVLATPLQT